MPEGSDSVLFFDFEISKEEDKIIDIGALLGPAEYHGSSLDKFREVLSGAEYICGHNILHKDNPPPAGVLLRGLREDTACAW